MLKKKRNFKIGDIVVCRQQKQIDIRTTCGSDYKKGGSGYKEGFIFKINDITKSFGPEELIILWPKDKNGVYADFVDYAENKDVCRMYNADELKKKKNNKPMSEEWHYKIPF